MSSHAKKNLGCAMLLVAVVGLLQAGKLLGKPFRRVDCLPFRVSSLETEGQKPAVTGAEWIDRLFYEEIRKRIAFWQLGRKEGQTAALEEAQIQYTLYYQGTTFVFPAFDAHAHPSVFSPYLFVQLDAAAEPIPRREGEGGRFSVAEEGLAAGLIGKANLWLAKYYATTFLQVVIVASLAFVIARHAIRYERAMFSKRAGNADPAVAPSDL